jgi:hypothetical protein
MSSVYSFERFKLQWEESPTQKCKIPDSIEGIPRFMEFFNRLRSGTFSIERSMCDSITDLCLKAPGKDLIRVEVFGGPINAFYPETIPYYFTVRDGPDATTKYEMLLCEAADDMYRRESHFKPVSIYGAGARTESGYVPGFEIFMGGCSTNDLYKVIWEGNQMIPHSTGDRTQISALVSQVCRSNLDSVKDIISDLCIRDSGKSLICIEVYTGAIRCIAPREIPHRLTLRDNASGLTAKQRVNIREGVMRSFSPEGRHFSSVAAFGV